MTNRPEDDGWQRVEPEQHLLHRYVSIDDLLPRADWFWRSLQHHCVAECCGLDAYDFSARSVAWACGWGTEPPWDIRGSAPRSRAQGAPRELAAALRDAAREVRALEAPAVSAKVFNHFLVPESCAALLEDLAAKAEPPTTYGDDS